MYGNSIRCCLCINKQPSSTEYFNLLVALDRLGCRYNIGILGRVTGYVPTTDQDIRLTESTLDSNLNQAKLAILADFLSKTQYLTIDCGWHTQNSVYVSELAQLHFPISSEYVRFTFSIPDTVLLQGLSIHNSPDKNLCFVDHKRIITRLIEFLHPVAAIVDFEADLLCDDLSNPKLLVGWGSFIPVSIISKFAKHEQQEVQNLVDDYCVIRDIGLLVYINPLAINQARTSKHGELQRLIRRAFSRD